MFLYPIKYFNVSANLNTYVISYLRNKECPTNGSNGTTASQASTGDPEDCITYADWIYLTTTKTFVQGLLMPFAGKLERRIGTRWSVILGCIIYT